MKKILLTIVILLLFLFLSCSGPGYHAIAITFKAADNLTFSAENLPRGATFNPDTRIFKWTPAYGQEGVYVVTFTVTDPEGLSDSENVTITVKPAAGCSADCAGPAIQIEN